MRVRATSRWSRKRSNGKARYIDHNFDIAKAPSELAEFKTLLDTNTDLKEREQVLTRFRDWLNLCAQFSKFHGEISIADRIKLASPIEGGFQTDLTVTLGDTDHIALAEFEGGVGQLRL